MAGLETEPDAFQGQPTGSVPEANQHRVLKLKVGKSTCKPGSVVDSHSSGTTVASRLEQPTRIQRESRHADSYSVLLQEGFTLPSLLPVTRCALTAPFHPYRKTGGIFSVALSFGSRRPGVTWHLYSMEPGLSSTSHNELTPCKAATAQSTFPTPH